MNVRRHAQRRHRAAVACVPRARVLRMRRLLRNARGVFAHLRELDAAASHALAPVLMLGHPEAAPHDWVRQRMVDGTHYARSWVPPVHWQALTPEQSALLDDLELGT